MIQKIKDAIQFFTANLALFSTIVLTVWLPGTILLVYLRLYVFPETIGNDWFRLFAEEWRVSNVIELACSPFYVGAMLHAAAQLKQGLSATYGKSMTHAARRSFKLLATRIGTSLIVLAGLVAFVIPGLVLAIRFALVDMAVVLEDVEGGRARSLSAKLTEGKRWSIFWTLTLTFIGLLIAVALAESVLAFLLASVGRDANFAILVIFGCVVSVLVTLPVIVLFLFYWDAKQAQSEIQNTRQEGQISPTFKDSENSLLGESDPEEM